MSKIVFFCIPAYGHTNPTIEVVHELTDRGNVVWYYSFNMFQEKIEGAGAKYISCDGYLPELRPEDEKKVGKDFATLIEMVVDTTIALDEKVCRELKEIKPDCIISDSLCFWGKLFAKKLNIPYACSTTTFALNQYTAKMMKQNFVEGVRMITGIPHINKKMKQLRANGYEVKNFLSLIQNDNETNTIVYTSKEFQPMVDTFSEKYSFVGPSVREVTVPRESKNHRRIYISLGTVNNKNSHFYKNCMEAFKNSDMDVIMSVGKGTSIGSLGEIPNNFVVKQNVEQIEVLQNTDVFITHCGMNSVSESLYYSVPMILFPQQSEQKMVANRVVNLGAGIMLKGVKPSHIYSAVQQVMTNTRYKGSARKLAESFRNSGGAKKAADTVLQVVGENI